MTATQEYTAGVLLLIAGLLLTFLAWPKPDGSTAPWLQRLGSANVAFPGILLALYALGVAEIVSAYLGK